MRAVGILISQLIPYNTMPNFNTDVAASFGKLGAAGLKDPALYNGLIQFIYATVTLSSSAAVNDTITITQPLPVGSTVIPHLCSAICHADPGTALGLDVGDAADADRYSAGLSLSSGGVVAFTTPSTIPAGILTPLKVVSPAPIIARLTTATSITNNSKISFCIALLVQA
jgi:hypothetical protein